jgi:hypothetical protein
MIAFWLVCFRPITRLINFLQQVLAADTQLLSMDGRSEPHIRRLMLHLVSRLSNEEQVT